MVLSCTVSLGAEHACVGVVFKVDMLVVLSGFWNGLFFRGFVFGSIAMWYWYLVWSVYK